MREVRQRASGPAVVVSTVRTIGPWSGGEVLAPLSHGCLHLFQVFYSEVGVDKSLQEWSHGVPLGLDTLTTVSSSILEAS